MLQAIVRRFPNIIDTRQPESQAASTYDDVIGNFLLKN